MPNFNFPGGGLIYSLLVLTEGGLESNFLISRLTNFRVEGSNTSLEVQVQISSTFVNFTAFNVTVPAGQSRLVYIVPPDIQANYLDIYYNVAFLEYKV